MPVVSPEPKPAAPARHPLEDLLQQILLEVRTTRLILSIAFNQEIAAEDSADLDKT